MYTKSAVVSTKPQYIETEALSEADAMSLTLADWDSMSYREQVAFKQLFPTAYGMLMEQQRRREDERTGRTPKF